MAIDSYDMVMLGLLATAVGRLSQLDHSAAIGHLCWPSGRRR